MGGKNFANAKGRIMKAYILRDMEAEEEVKKAKKAKSRPMDKGELGTSGEWRT